MEAEKVSLPWKVHIVTMLQARLSHEPSSLTSAPTFNNPGALLTIHLFPPPHHLV